MSTQLIKDLVKFFEERQMHDVAQGLGEDLNALKKKNQSDVLLSIRKALNGPELTKAHLAAQNTKER